jgi:hypothetical protein
MSCEIRKKRLLESGQVSLKEMTAETADLRPEAQTVERLARERAVQGIVQKPLVQAAHRSGHWRRFSKGRIEAAIYPDRIDTIRLAIVIVYLALGSVSKSTLVVPKNSIRLRHEVRFISDSTTIQLLCP